MAFRAATTKGQFAGELVIPGDIEKALFFGPSLSTHFVTNLGVENRVILWVGGAGLAVDGRWGEPISFSWVTPVDYDRNFVLQQSKLMLRSQFGQISRHYTVETAKIILSMLENGIDGHTYKRRFAYDEAKEFIHD